MSGQRISPVTRAHPPEQPMNDPHIQTLYYSVGHAEDVDYALDDIEGADQIVADTAFQSPTAEDLTGSDIGISESISVITNIKHSPATTPTRRSKPGLIESGGPSLWTMLITNANIACVPT